MAQKKTLRIASWNVNGLRSASNKGFTAYLAKGGADILGLQEVRADEHQIDPDIAKPKDWHTHFFPAERKGYSGVALYARDPYDDLYTSLGRQEFDCEGRLQIARFGALTLVNGYFPNGSGKNRDNSRVPYKLEFYRTLYQRLEKAKQKNEAILVMGDFNIAHQPIDLARPKDNEKTSGFLLEEREELDRWLKNDWTDTFRHFEKGPGHYSWWSQRAGARARNVGWRIDYVLASPGALPYVRAAKIHPDVFGSDHCPVSVDVSTDILKHN